MRTLPILLLCFTMNARAAAQDGAREPVLAAIARGVDHLAAQQRDDGSWSDGPGSAHDAATTALAALALLADGNTLTGGPRSASLARAVGWLRGRLGDDGSLLDPGPRRATAAGTVRRSPVRSPEGADDAEAAPVPTALRRELDQALVAFALCEAGGISADDAVRDDGGRAVAALLALRVDEGGWQTGFAPGETDPTLVTAWAHLAVLSARSHAKHLAPRRDGEARELARWMGLGGPPAGWPPSATPRAPDAARLMVAQFEGLVDADTDLERLGIDPGAVIDAAGATRDDPLARHIAIFAAFQRGGALWRRMREPLAQLVGLQRDDGSWPSSKRWEQDGGGDVSATALTVLSLRTYARFTRVVR